MTAQCKQCNHAAFTSLSDLRKHQWADHRDLYKNMISKRKTKKLGKWSDAQKAKFKATWEAKRAAIAVATKDEPATEMTARQLLERLKEQRDFMVDLVQLVTNIIGE